MNRQRGTIAIKLLEKTYECRLDFNALCEIEEITGCSAVEIVADSRNKLPPIKRIVAIVWAGIRGGMKDQDKAPSMDEVGRMCISAGIQTLWPECLKMVTLSICSDEMYEIATKEAEGEVEGNDQPPGESAEDIG